MTERVLASVFEVSNNLGAGFLERVYRRALLHELRLRGIRAAAEVSFPATYKGHGVGEYFADILVENVLVIELKCAERLSNEHTAQCLNYLPASGRILRLLVNFQKPTKRWLLGQRRRLNRLRGLPLPVHAGTSLGIASRTAAMVLDLHDRRGSDRLMLRVAEFQLHAAADRSLHRPRYVDASSAKREPTANHGLAAEVWILLIAFTPTALQPSSPGHAKFLDFEGRRLPRIKL